MSVPIIGTLSKLLSTFKNQAEVIEHMKRAKAVLRTYKILKRVKKGSFNNEVITSIMENQTTTPTLSVVSEALKDKIPDPRIVHSSK